MEPPAEFIAQFTRSQRLLHTYILSLVWNPAEAEDVLQETNLALWQKAEEFDPGRPFLPWAMRFAQVQTMSWMKKRRRQQALLGERFVELLADDLTVEQGVLERRLTALADCLDKLGPEQRALVWKRYEPGGTVRAMAAAARIPAKLMSDRLRRIRLALLACIERAIAREATS